MSLLYNIGIGAAELVYVFAIIISMNYLVGIGKISKSTSRKVVHLWLGGLILFWFLFNSSIAQWLFTIPIFITIVLLLFGTIAGGGYKQRMMRFTRSGDAKEVLFGPLIFLLIFILFTFVAFKTPGGVAALCAMTFGDGIAPIAGKYAKYKYFDGRKSIEGSLALFIGTLFSIFVMFIVFFPNLSSLLLFIAIIASLVATLVEAFTPSKYDNLTVPIATWLVFLAI